LAGKVQIFELFLPYKTAPLNNRLKTIDKIKTHPWFKKINPQDGSSLFQTCGFVFFTATADT